MPFEHVYGGHRLPSVTTTSFMYGTHNTLTSLTWRRRVIIYTSSVATLGLKKRGQSNENTPVSFSDMIGDYKKSKYLANAFPIHFEVFFQFQMLMSILF